MSPDEQELIQRIIYTSFFVPLLLGLFLILFVVFYLKKKHRLVLEVKEVEIREKEQILLSEVELKNERNRIASDMHDDLGGGLTSIRMLINKVKSKGLDEKNIISLDKIERHSSELIDNMKGIVWAINSQYDALADMISYLKHFIVNYFEENDIACDIQILRPLPYIVLDGTKRRNLFLSIKECAHNIVKHGQATKVNARFEILNSQLYVKILDNGIGYDTETDNNFGNGIKSMNIRMSNIGGRFTIESQDIGTLVTLSYPINAAGVKT